MRTHLTSSSYIALTTRSLYAGPIYVTCMFQGDKLTRPSKTQHISGGNSQTLRDEAILHGGIGLNNISSLSHPSDVNYPRIFNTRGSWLQVKHMCSVLESTSELSGVQG